MGSRGTGPPTSATVKLTTCCLPNCWIVWHTDGWNMHRSRYEFWNFLEVLPQSAQTPQVSSPSQSSRLRKNTRSPDLITYPGIPQLYNCGWPVKAVWWTGLKERSMRRQTSVAFSLQASLAKLIFVCDIQTRCSPTRVRASMLLLLLAKHRCQGAVGVVFRRWIVTHCLLATTVLATWKYCYLLAYVDPYINY